MHLKTKRSFIKGKGTSSFKAKDGTCKCHHGNGKPELRGYDFFKDNESNKEVATISKLFNNDTLAEFVLAMPSISRMGAIISNNTIAIVCGSSFCQRGLFLPLFR